MEIGWKFVLSAAGAVLLSFFLLTVYFTVQRNSFESRIVQLQNDVAQRDKTIETQAGVYERLALQNNDLQHLLNGRDQEIVLLKNRLEKSKEEILALTRLSVSLKEKLESNTSSPVVVDPASPTKFSVVIDSGHDIDPFHVFGDVEGDLSTKQSKTHLTFEQVKPLSFALAVTQNEKGEWRGIATSSSDKFKIEFSTLAVNPHIFEEKWYEKIGVAADLGLSTRPGVLFGVGASYRIGRFDVGPHVWATVDTTGAAPYFGAQMNWHPFAR